MQRKAYQLLKAWKQNPNRKPLVIQGARQVGKTWLMKEFGTKEFESLAYFNFEANKELHGIFKQGFDPDTILLGLAILWGKPIEIEKTLVVFDEIQACPEAITSLKYFQEGKSRLAILAGGSLLGVAIHQGTSFPVGKVDFLTLYPLDFHEFLLGIGQAELVKLLESKNWEMINVFKDKLASILKHYYFVGGMPEVVNEFARTGDFHAARLLQNNILMAYENDFSKHAPIAQLPRIRMVWHSILGQLAKENSKFIYNILRTGARAKEFEMALEWLKDAGLIQQVTRIKKVGFPLSAYTEWSDFKIYLNDVGLLTAMANLSPEIILKENDLFTEFKGKLSEQFVLQQLISEQIQGYYWNPENTSAEVDFVIQRENELIPIEVKSGENLKSRSLHVYFEKYQPSTCLRTSILPYKDQGWMRNIPLYGILGWIKNEKKLPK
jgi:uncharacterized protein